MSLNWHDIRPLDGSQRDGFEELVCQLARKEEIPSNTKFIRKGKPDAGVECFWILENGDELAWQAKYFTTSITSTQWGELDLSVKTVLEKHPNLKKYYIAIPNDPPDARIPNQDSMLQKWGNHVEKWCEWAKKKGMTIEIIPWWSSDLIERLQKPENVGLTYFWFSKDEFTIKWFRDQTEEAIADLGNRYTPELNVKLDISKAFDQLSRNERLSNEIFSLLDKLLEKSQIVIKHTKSIKEKTFNIIESINILKEQVLSIEIKGIADVPLDKITKSIDGIIKIINEINDYYYEKEYNMSKEDTNYRINTKYGYELYCINEFYKKLDEFGDYFKSDTIRLVNQPYMLIEGIAGSGKSHLIADAVSERNKKDVNSLLFLGQHFLNDNDPWTQIFTKNKIKCSVDEFLSALEAKGQSCQSRTIIFIDAINEGRGLYFWDEYIRGFLNRIKKYNWLGLVLSIRSTYTPVVFSEKQWRERNFIRVIHNGFANEEYNAVKKFFGFYGIARPNVPMLSPEFNNPLFLKLFCEGLNKTNINSMPRGIQGITTVFNNYIEGINKTLANRKKLDYPDSINIVKEALYNFIKYKYNNKNSQVTYSEAYKLISKVAKRYGLTSNLLDNMISEGIFVKNVIYDNETQLIEVIYVAYERFADHLTAEYLLDKYNKPWKVKNAFKKYRKLNYLISDENACYANKGLLEALAVQLPEKFECELYEIAIKVANSYPIIECFIQSLLWRKTETISEKLLNYINKCVSPYRRANEKFWCAIVSVAVIPGHYFNANFIHRNLMKHSIADRDRIWTTRLKNEYWSEFDGTIHRLLDWASDDDVKSHISSDAIKLSAITISWFLTSTNRELRDKSTKALVKLLNSRIEILMDVLKEFTNVNDPYILERLFAVAYGCALRTSEKDILPQLCDLIYKTIFDVKDEVYPNILLRDYARGIIEYTIQLGYSLNINVKKIRPPYKSILPDSFPSYDEIEKLYRLDYKSEDFKDYHWSQNNILSSMTTEHGKGMYGDFGRYTFESAVRNWDVDPIGLSNLAISWIFDKYGYDVEKHGEFDRTIGHGRGRDTYPHERIGKKYQWIAMYEILAKVADNCDLYADSYSKEKRIYYKGTWDMFVRDIDPTFLGKANDSSDLNQYNSWYSQIMYDNWDTSNEEWIYSTDDLPDCADILCKTDDDGDDWIMLQGYPEWTEPKLLGIKKHDLPHKRMWYQLRSYIVEENDFNKLVKWGREKNFMGRWMPENHDSYTVLYREYYWSNAYKECYYNEEVFPQFVVDKDNGDTICETEVTVNNYIWEKSNDYSIEESIYLLTPSKEIFNAINLQFSKKDGEYLDKDNNIVCFNTLVRSDKMHSLMIRKEPLLAYLKENKKKIVWTLLGEKYVTSGVSSSQEFNKRLCINGLYHFDDNEELIGEIIPTEE